MVVKWNIFVQDTNTQMDFLLNPQEGGPPDRKKSLYYAVNLRPSEIGGHGLTSSDGHTLAVEQGSTPWEINWSGVILSKEEYDFFHILAGTQSICTLTDDLGNVWPIFIAEFVPKRVFNRNNFWRHSYTIRAPLIYGTTVVSPPPPGGPSVVFNPDHGVPDV